MGENLTKRFERVLAILVQLQAKKIVRAQDLASRFDVSTRTIYRDIKSLLNAGIPVAGDAGIGYSIMEGYHLSPAMFNLEESTAFITAEKLVQEFTDAAMAENFSSGLFKIKSLLQAKDQERLQHINKEIHVKSRKAAVYQVQDALPMLMKHIADKFQLNLKYEGESIVTERFIEPVGLFHENDKWYVMAYCHLRHAYRQFRIDRIIALQKSSKPFEKQHESLSHYRQNGKKYPKQSVTIAVNRNMAEAVNWSKKQHGWVAEEKKDDAVIMHFETSYAETWFVYWFLQFASGAKVISPDTVKQAVKKRLQEALQNCG